MIRLVIRLLVLILGMAAVRLVVIAF